MKQILITFLLTLSLASFGQGHVEDFKANGWFGDTDILDRAEEFLGFGGSCAKATREEFDYIENKTPGVFIENSEGIKTTDDFDNWSEELVFSSTAQKVQEQSSCQNKLFQGLARDKDAAKLMEDHAWYQFSLVRDKIKDLLGVQEGAQERLDQVRSNSNYREDRYSARMTNYWQEQIQQKSADLREAKAKVAMAFARLPLGNRVEMRDVLTELFDSNSISEYQFRLAYQRGVGILREQARKSFAFFNEIQDENGKHLYYVDEDLKKSLVQSGVVANLVEGLGMEEALKNKFMCRANARYKRGPQALLAAEIPLYFTGMYGLGRAAVAMGAKAVTIASRSGRGATIAAQYSARAAMLGLDAYAYARIADEVRQVCWKDEYTAALQAGGSCNFASEVSGVYQEASIGQCATMAALGFGPLAAVTAVRVAKPLNQIVVTAGKAGKSDFYTSGAAYDRLANSPRVKQILRSDDFNPNVASKLTDEERIFLIEDISGVGLTKAEAQRLLSAHKRGRGYGDYSFSDLRFKSSELRDVLRGAGLSDESIREVNRRLMQQGILGSAKGSFKLPNAAVEKIEKIKTLTKEKPFDKTPLSHRNDLTFDDTPSIPEIIKKHPDMAKPFKTANEMLANGKKWNQYLEDIVTEVFENMAKSSDPKIVALAEEGVMARSSLLEVFTKRFEARGLKISTIPENSGVLSFDEFRSYLKQGPLLDDAFQTGLVQHGPYPHLFQLDYLLDDMVKVAPKKDAQQFFDFWGGSDEGLSVWNDMFDLFDQTPGRTGPHTLKDTRAVTEGYLDHIGIDNSL
ncbi:MAG: hypothetical protein CME62_12165 [Halobacteriovoraceae bacterium]|nr:hypothetical protein [Halobacteriovoraceae bacterium]